MTQVQLEYQKHPHRELIDNFLDLKRIAFVGVSSNPKDFSRMIYKELVKRDYEIIPVNPNIDEIDGVKVFPSIKGIDPTVEGVFVMTTAGIAEQIVQECIEAEIKNVWLHKGVGKGSVNDKVLSICEENGIEVVPGYCPFMFLPESNFPHNIHRFFKKLKGSFPR